VGSSKTSPGAAWASPPSLCISGYERPAQCSQVCMLQVREQAGTGAASADAACLRCSAPRSGPHIAEEAPRSKALKQPPLLKPPAACAAQ